MSRPIDFISGVSHLMTMVRLVSKALQKLKEDGFLSLLSEGFPWLYRRVRGRIRDQYKRSLLRRYFRVKYGFVDGCDQYLYLDPSDIEYYLLNSSSRAVYGGNTSSDVPLHKMEKGRFDPSVFTGCVLSGDWDLYKKPYEYDRVYNGLYQHYECGLDLNETEYMCHYEIRGIVRDDEEYLERNKQKKTSLYDSIRNDGFMTQYDLGRKDEGVPIYAKPWGITVNIGRDGEIIFNNSAHNRLAVSKLVDLSEIPVLVVVRHNEWQSIREEVRGAESYETLSKKAKDSLDHPDLENFVPEEWVSDPSYLDAA